MIDRKTAPSLSEFTSLSLPDFKERQLSNGIRLLWLDSGEEEVNRLTFIWDAGIADVDCPAALDLMSNLLLEGCQNLSGQEVTDILESKGAWFKASVSNHALLLTLHSLNHTSSEVFPLMKKIITSPSFPEEAITSLKQKSASEKEISSRKPSYQANIIAREAVYGVNHPLSTVITPEKITGVTREQIIKLHQGIMLSNTPTIVISGKITDGILNEVESVFGNMKFPKNPGGQIRRTIHSIPSLSSDKIVRKELPTSLQTAIRIQIPTILPQHPDFEALRFTTVLLGGYFGSRLMRNIREEKGYTYGISANLIPGLESGNIVINCECDNKYTDAVISEINKELDILSKEPVSPDELETVRSVLISSLAGILDSPFSIAGFREMTETFGITPDWFSTKFSEIRAMTPDKISLMATRYMKHGKKVVAIAGGKPG